MYNLKKSAQADHNDLKQTTGVLDKELYPMAHNQNSLSGGHHTLKSTLPAPSHANNSALIGMVNRQTRFNYNDYMKTLQDKLSLTAPNTTKLAG